jgi:hypothetical protein
MPYGQNAEGKWVRPPLHEEPRSAPRQVESAPDDGFEHTCRHGYVFKCPKADLSEPIRVTIPGVTDPTWIMCDVAEMIGYHATNILPGLDGFQGYDAISFDMAG